MNNVLLTAGVASVILAVVGGGAQAWGLTVPVLDSVRRQALLGLAGIVFLVMAFAAGEGGGGNNGQPPPAINPLVKDVRRAVNDVTSKGEQFATRTAQGNADFYAALGAWRGDSLGIVTDLETSFPKARFQGEPIPRAWDRYSKAVENLYFLSATEIAAADRTRCDRTKDLMAYLHVSTANLKCPKRSWTTCSTLPRHVRFRCFKTASNEWRAACHRATSWHALALCDEDSVKPSGEGYIRGNNYFTAYKAATEKLRNQRERLLAVLRAETPAGS